METVDEQIRQGLIDGAVVLAGTPEQDLFSGAWGSADRINQVPMTLETIFDIASVTKAVGTNSVLLAAVSDGLLELDRPFTDYLPEFTGKISAPVTVRELALHISGVNINYCREGSPETMRRRILAVDFLCPPRLRYQYTCTSYILLGMLLENLYGKRLDEIAGKRIFEPLHMKETGWGHPVATVRSGIIRTVNADPGVISDEGARNYAPLPLGNAGIFSTASDLAKYARMMLCCGGTVFPSGIMDLCFTDFNPPEIGHPRSLGWDMLPDMIPAGLSERTVFHSGWTGQTVWIDPGTSRFIMVLTNRMKKWDRAQYGRKEIAEEVLSRIDRRI